MNKCKINYLSMVILLFLYYFLLQNNRISVFVGEEWYCFIIYILIIGEKFWLFFCSNNLESVYILWEIIYNL